MIKFLKIKNIYQGFGLIESIVGIAIFLLLSLTVYQTFFVISKQAQSNYENSIVSHLADQYLEAVRNIPYSQIGTISGNPNGNLEDSSSPANIVVNGTSYQVYYEVTYIDDPADGTIVAGTDFASNDYKQVKLSVKNLTTNNVKNFITNVSPSGLESLANGGALSLSVIDAFGQPVTGATINITNTSIIPHINLTRTSGSTGKWIEVGLPDDSNNYHIVVTKNGYSSDQTYPITVSNPNPTKPDATIANGQITAISFAIDKTSNLTFNTLNQTCDPISDIGLGIKGSKIIGTPSFLKFNNNYTSNTNGQVVLNNLEWDNYTPALIGNSYMIYGSSPIQQINLLPNTIQQFNLILGPVTNNSLLVIVKDSGTGNPIEGASVKLESEDLDYSRTYITGGSLWSQQFWNGGDGQTDWLSTNKYFADDGGISATDTPLAMRLTNANGQTIANSGILTSSTFDTGSAETLYTTFDWSPSSQDPSTNVKFQIATNNDNLTWNFTGPDGTSNTYYTTPGTTIDSSNNYKEYIRYKAFLSTTDSAKNPTVTSVNINYVSGCFTPGQVIFPGLNQESDYKLTVNMPGYQTKFIYNLNITGYNVLQVLLTPN